jgi:predicted RND superfamily exporter protein
VPAKQLYERGLLVLVSRPIWVIALVLLVTAFSVTRMVDLRTGLPRIQLDPSTDSLLPSDDPGRHYYERIKQIFDSGETMLVAMVSDDVFTSQNLQRLQRMTERFEELDLAARVSSLSTALNIRGSEGELVVEPFFEDVPTDAAALADLRRRALADPIYSGNLISEDGRIAVVAIYLMDVPEQELIESGIDEQIASIASEESGPNEVWISGAPRVKAEMTRLMLSDISQVIPLAGLIMSLVAFVSFRTLRGVLVPLLTVGLSMAWTMAYVASMFGTLNQVTVAAPPIMLVVGFAYSIHILAAYYDVIRSGQQQMLTPAAAVTGAVREVAVPVFFTGITTAAGFFSLMTSPLSAISQFGAFCGIGVTVTMVMSLTFAPAALALMPIPQRVREGPSRGAFDDFLERLAIFDVRNRGRILLVGALAAVASLVGMSRIDIGTDMVSSFKRSNPVRQDFDSVNQNLQGANAFNVVLETTAPDAFKEPANLAVLEDLQTWLADQPEVGGSTSFADYIKVINQGLGEGGPDGFRIPESRELVSQLLIIGGNDEIDSFVDSGFQVANILVRTTAMDSARIMELVRRLEARLEAIPPHLQSAVTGNSILISRTMDDIALGQSLSLGTAFLFIYAILVVLFTSFRAGFLALIPNALPVLLYFGILGWTGVTLNTTTGLVACLVLGIAVDDTIHLMSHFNTAARRHASETKGVVDALSSVGRPVTYTTAALCLGFLTLLLSSMNSQIDFGWLAAVTLGAAWVVDLTFTPALASRMRIVTIWDVLTLDLGEEPHLTIPLFSGLKHHQARIVALMTSTRRFGKGERIFEAGERGEEMFVVIEGTLRAYVLREGVEVTLREMSRGDVIGEVALFHGVRSANVRAETDVRLLRLTQQNLQRLQRRHPRIGAQIYANLNVVMANRLASVTERVA